MAQIWQEGRVYIHGVGVDRLSFEQAVAKIKQRLTCSNVKPPSSVFTPNAEMIYRATTDSSLAELLNSGDVNTADGVGTVWASHRLGTPLPERVAGIELGEAALKIAAECGLGVFLLGGKPGIADRAATLLKQRLPSLIISGTHHGYFEDGSAEEAALRSRIRESGAHLLIVCLGFPRQERWIADNKSELGKVRVAMALGGSLDVWAGEVRRAPEFIRHMHLEWMWRIMRDPRRWRRAATLPRFVILTVKNRKKAVVCPNEPQK